VNDFLFDENLPSKITFKPRLPVVHARELAVSASDTMLWSYARQHSLAVVTKDADFQYRALLTSPPPWVVHLRFGNLRRRDFLALLARLWPRIEALLPSHKLVNVYADRIEAIRS
jgi:predicted nuclease of predicted toxin-antitoxin system